MFGQGIRTDEVKKRNKAHAEKEMVHTVVIDSELPAVFDIKEILRE